MAGYAANRNRISGTSLHHAAIRNWLQHTQQSSFSLGINTISGWTLYTQKVKKTQKKLNAELAHIPQCKTMLIKHSINKVKQTSVTIRWNTVAWIFNGNTAAWILNGMDKMKILSIAQWVLYSMIHSRMHLFWCKVTRRGFTGKHRTVTSISHETQQMNIHIRCSS